MTKPRRTPSTIKENIARLEQELRAAEERTALRIGRVAVEAGLGDLECSERELKEAFGQIRRRFLDRASKGADKPAADAASIDDGVRADSHDGPERNDDAGDDSLPERTGDLPPTVATAPAPAAAHV